MHYDFANIEVRPFLKLSDVNSPYIFGETKHVINMCDYREPEVIDLIHAKGGTFDWFPTSQTNKLRMPICQRTRYAKRRTSYKEPFTTNQTDMT